ncbi:MAG TPA: di-heme-cytochrome C peroxidase [Candidatus Angelobacter sp.]|nr:di-heme-cytochrome C peroxidase [Candidatus Angelobacter sp.]
MSTKPGRGHDSSSDEPQGNVSTAIPAGKGTSSKKNRWIYGRVRDLNAWWTRRRRWHKIGISLLLLIVAAVALNSAYTRWLDYWDVGANSWFAHFESGKAAWAMQRGAAIMDQPSKFDNQYKSVRYLDQKWSPADSLWFYNTTQGSDLIPYDFFMAVQDPQTGKVFHTNATLYDYGYLPQVKTYSNPDALPVGFVKDTYKGKSYVGFTCAACHTGQVNYKGTAIRIDGGPAGSDMDTFLQDMGAALSATQKDDTARQQFVQRVLARKGDYSSADKVRKDLEIYSERLEMYNVVNRSPTRYGYYRLDAFGRIFNRVLEHVITQEQLNSVMKDMVRDGILTQPELDAILSEKADGDDNVLTGKRRDHLVLRLSKVLEKRPKALLTLRNRIFNKPNAPVSYPFLWDIPQHDYVQWNGIVQNAGLGPIGRNAGEVIGVFATLDWAQEKGFSLSAIINGQGLKWNHINFDSSVNVHNLQRLEHHLENLESPQWPEDIFGKKIDEKSSGRGEKLFSEFCAGCHTNINRADPKRRVVASMTKLQELGTDNTMALNAVSYNGLSGILRNSYTTSGGGPVLINERAPVAALLTKATLSVVATPSANKNFIRRGLDWADDLITSFLSNDIKPSIKQGDYDPDTTAKPYESLKAYKGRSLNGIWATAPYLHNGSVPTLYDLLLPSNPEDAKNPSAGVECRPVPAGVEYRPCKFMVGSREFDPDKVGLRSTGYDGFVFNTKLPGNSNGGHEYGTKGITLPNGEKRGPLTKDERMDLLEYLKTL